jgi:hypothetical protein
MSSVVDRLAGRLTPLTVDSNPMRLDERPESARRIMAARILRGLERSELADLFAAQGFGWHDVAKLERGDPKMPLTPARRGKLAEILRVPEWWFTAPEEELWSRGPGLAAVDEKVIQEAVREATTKIIRAQGQAPSGTQEGRPSSPNPGGGG